MNNILKEYLHEEENDGDESEDEEEAEAEAQAEEETKAEAAPAAEAEATAEPEKKEEDTPPAAADEHPTFTGSDTDKMPAVIETPIVPEDTFLGIHESQTLANSSEIEIMDAAPEPMDDFEDLDAPAAPPAEPQLPKEDTDVLPMDFEELV